MDTHTVREALPVATDTLGRRIVPRRHRTVEEKIRIVEESMKPGASAAEVARRHELNANLLFGWRRQYEQGVLGARTRRGSARKPQPKLVRVQVADAALARSAGVVEIELGARVRVRVSGEAPVAQIEAVLRALKAEAR